MTGERTQDGESAAARRLEAAVAAGTAAALWPLDAPEGFAAALARMWPRRQPCRILVRPGCAEPPRDGLLGPDRPLLALGTPAGAAAACAELGVTVLLAEAREEVDAGLAWIPIVREAGEPDMDDRALNATVLGKLRRLGYI